MLIGIDGINGAGKSSLLGGLKEYFTDAVFVREPGETELGSDIRKILLNRDYTIDPLSEYLMFAADHNENWSKVVKPAIQQGKTVFTDRSYLSSLAFQGELGTSRSYIQTINKMIGLPDYDMFIILDCDLDVAESRMGHRSKDLIESRSRDFHARVQKYFIDFCFVPGFLPRKYINTTQKTPKEVLDLAIDYIETALATNRV